MLSPESLIKGLDQLPFVRFEPLKIQVTLSRLFGVQLAQRQVEGIEHMQQGAHRHQWCSLLDAVQC